MVARKTAWPHTSLFSFFGIANCNKPTETEHLLLVAWFIFSCTAAKEASAIFDRTMATMHRRLIQIITIASIASLVAASLFETNVLISFVNDTPWLSDLLDLPADGMCKHNENVILSGLFCSTSVLYCSQPCVFVTICSPHTSVYVSHYSGQIHTAPSK